MLLNDLMNATSVVRWSKRGEDIKKSFVSRPDLRSLRKFKQVDGPAKG
jgi:hypothetical protein